MEKPYMRSYTVTLKVSRVMAFGPSDAVASVIEMAGGFIYHTVDEKTGEDTAVDAEDLDR